MLHAISRHWIGVSAGLILIGFVFFTKLTVMLIFSALGIAIGAFLVFPLSGVKATLLENHRSTSLVAKLLR
jgi:hypothetical protein